ncbi:pleckstrin homology domain-containing family G member 4B-like isoform X3 [Pimephales promelas]|uniref:pleckstrin homology domain-containing family G member 4B-like isoform X3 n=1 Tax=Pimephales promelas TaxID=90988 RepID=UPI001955D040|nr:pleckstrin homology domain-containing family G member 4B-like isoform X3 [Pimephales promelas]XP_039516815.1 pleckstrin homology domain-containing family G member 4B-like isoform X3 [Pimephales promelas]
MRTLSTMHSRVKSRSCDNYLSIKDSESLDHCIQSTLSALYPPFSVSAVTVLWQLFSVVERQYRGDGLRCFIDFLLPAKRILQIIKEEACLRFKGLLLYHEGWPLCLHEKVVLQLAPLHKVRLRQGDFYLQVVPLGRKAAKLVIKCLSGSGQAIAEIPVAESMYGSIFTPDFLQNVTRERNLQPLQNCLLSTGAVVYRTPWKNVVNPLFVTSTADAIMQARSGGATLRGQLSTCSTHGSTGTLSSRDSLGGESTVSEPVLSRSLTDMGIGSLRSEDSPLQKSPSTDQGCIRGRIGHKMLSFSTDLSNPGLRKRHPRDSTTFESRRLFRKSYMEALQNPMNLGSSSESILEEGTESTSPGSASKEPIPRRICARGWLGGDVSRNDSPAVNPPKNTELSPDERRSKSLERTHKALQVKGHRARSSSGGSSGLPKKLMNGYAFRFGKLDLEAAFPGIEKRSSKECSGVPDDGPRRNSNSGDELVPPKPSIRPAASPVPSSTPPAVCSPPLPSLMTQLNQELLTSAAITLPGNQDRSGRAVLQVCTRNQVWTDASRTTNQITGLLCYYCNRLRREKRDLGLTVLVDARRQPATSTLISALSQFQTSIPNALYSVLFLVDKDAAVKVERDVTVPFEVLTSLKALQKHIDSSQLTIDFDGTFPYDHSHYIHFRQKIEPFATSCSAAISSLQSSIETLNNIGNLETSEEVLEIISQQKDLMKSILDDTQLNRLRLEGGTFLARIRKEEMCENENYRDAVDMVSALYNQVDEEVHKLVILSNKSLQQLETLLELRTLQERHEEVKRWFYVESEKHLAPLDSYSLSVSSIRDMRQSLAQFMEESTEQQKKAAVLLRESKAGPALQEVKQHMSTVLQRSEARKNELEVLHNLYEFYESANQWMVHCQEYFCQLRVDDNAVSYTPAVLRVLQDYHSEATKFSLDNFSALNQMVLNLNSPRELQQWSNIWQKCQQTKQQLEEALANAAKESKLLETQNGSSELPSLNSSSTLCFEYEDEKPLSAGPFSGSQFPFPPESGNLSPSPFDDTDSDCTVDSSASCHSEPLHSPATRQRKQPLKKIMKKTLSYELTARDKAHPDAGHHGYTGIYIKGLEVTNNVCVEKKLQRPDVKSPSLGRSRSMSSPSRVCRHSAGDVKTHSSKIQHIMDEMIATEREYVRSLSYIIQHYFPEMERLDLPQDLRGKRSIIFGNLEKLCDFHSQFFLKDLEICAHSPLSISSCFLQHEEQFGMYALYSKNKPRSDALLISHGNSFFKNKQVELGDKMDLASYLLKPIQRMSKYALLLKDLIKECGHSQEQELTDLRTAEEMVKFQLRHGNDLLAMDAIRGCDVNLKEQGQLRCQDEFIVWCGRKKYLRHVFLFEDLILFSKTKKIEGGYDIYIYKQSYKTAEIGMTENVGDSGLRFEIWFRRRKSQDTFILQASSGEVKAAWTSVIGKILWRQALRNRELRMQEMVSMGIGNKPFMDIKPSDSAISDRAVDYIMKGSESRMRASIAVSSFDHTTPFKRPHSTISNSSSSSSSSQSSSSLLGSLNLHLYPSHPLPGCPSLSHWPYDCIEEDELEHDSTVQSSMIRDSAESSSQCTSSDRVQRQPASVMESYTSDGGSYLSSHTPSPSPPKLTSSILYRTDTQSSGFITAL